MRIEEVLTAPHSPWQSPFVERLIGSVRRDCLDHVVVLSQRHLCRILTRYFDYYHRSRTHLSLDKNTPDTRPIARPAFGHIIIQIPDVGGLHHRYERRAAESRFTQTNPSPPTLAPKIPFPLPRHESDRANGFPSRAATHRNRRHC